MLKGRIVNNNTIPAGASISEGQQFLIHEEGELERWFNLTITNVGLESVADYTCVAVNAGGVMEENISLTFEEPEPVGLPGGKKEESNLAIIIGAAAGGFLFVFVLLLMLCCCCCRRRIKQHSSTPSSASRTPERHGSVIGFADSNSSQRLIQHHNNHHHHQHQHPIPPMAISGEYSQQAMSPSSGSPTASSSTSVPSLPSGVNGMMGPGDTMFGRQQSMSRIAELPGNVTNHHYHHHQVSSPSENSAQVHIHELELQDMREMRPKQVMVSSIGDTNYESGIVGDAADHYPDLLNIPHRYQATSPPSSKPQPLNPAALVVPPTPPLKFPHQFPHLIHSNRSNSSNSLPQGPSRSHSYETHPSGSQTLLSPPAQFNTTQQMRDSLASMAPGYVTLPRNNRPLQAPGSGQHVNWDTLGYSNMPMFKGEEDDRCPIYDGVGPRTSAMGGTGSSMKQQQQQQHLQHQHHQQQQPLTNPEMTANSSASNASKSLQFTLNRPCPTIPEEVLAPGGLRDGSPQQRDSSGSEVTLGEDGLGGFCEPFGKALPPSVNRAKNRDSIASSADSDMDGLLGNTIDRCPLHKTHSVPNPTYTSGKQQQPLPPKGGSGGSMNSTSGGEVKQLKGILKGGSLNKNPITIRTGLPIEVSSSSNSSGTSTPANIAAFHPMPEGSRNAKVSKNLPKPRSSSSSSSLGGGRRGGNDIEALNV
ncbi:hypothetical protein TCAL_16922 [Tigriopus californicus]|uniref:Immunoglobulin I-set domain-containing protein n=1 Tax=Tigriopus californicus TaxID=6832 RepID=A0A553P889_TIGCA|nr:hypothetical protein TCAL_16922 [Tigriopus californicus]